MNRHLHSIGLCAPILCAILCAALPGTAFLGAAALVATPASAQSRDDRQFMLRDPFRRAAPPPPFFGFPILRDPRPEPRAVAPRRPRAAPRAVEREPEPPAAVVYGSSEAADRNRATQATEYVVVLGDSLADQLAQGLVDAFGTERPEVAVVKKTRGSSGLVRADFYDWPAQVPELLADEKATAIVIMIGTNDRQALRDESGAHEIRSHRWRELYAQRVDAMINEVKQQLVPVIVVGLPAMRTRRLSEDMQYINEILRERAQALGATFVDVWDGFVNEQDEFVSSGPALDGQTRRLRIADGVHFTRVGARKLAHYAERDLVRIFDRRAPGLELPTDGLETTPGGRPIAGPILPLNQPAGPVGGLADGERRSVHDVTARVLTEGMPIEPVAGRADDFRWPRPPEGFAPVAPPVPEPPAEADQPSSDEPERAADSAAASGEPAPAPANTGPAETKSDELKPADTKPAESQPAESQPAGTKPAEASAGEQRAETEPVEAKPDRPAQTPPAPRPTASAGRDNPDLLRPPANIPR